MRAKANVFISYTTSDQTLAAGLEKALRQAKFSAYTYMAHLRHGRDISGEVEAEIRQSDVVAVLLSEESAGKPWIGRELGLARTLQKERAPYNYPAILGVLHPDLKDTSHLQVALRDYWSGDLTGEVMAFESARLVRLSGIGADADFSSFIASLTPQVRLLDDLDDREQEQLFGQAMRLYADLITDEGERDSEENIRRWIRQSRDRRHDWLHVLFVMEVHGHVVGAFWCNVHKETRLGFVPFFGLCSSCRHYNRAEDLATGAIRMICRKIPDLRGLFFEAEPVDWEILDKYAGDAAAAAEEPEIGPVIEELKRFRRFNLYTGYPTSSLRGFSLKAYVQTGDHEVAVPYIQPPIIEPVVPENERKLFLFCLVRDGGDVPADEALEWIYEVFLRSQFGEGPGKLRGWNEYVDALKPRVIRDFAATATLAHLERYERYKKYEDLLRRTQAWIRTTRTGGHWSLQL